MKLQIKKTLNRPLSSQKKSQTLKKPYPIKRGAAITSYKLSKFCQVPQNRVGCTGEHLQDCSRKQKDLRLHLRLQNVYFKYQFLYICI